MNKNIEKLVRLATHQLPNELHFIFMTENCSIYKKYDFVTLGIDIYQDEYNSTLADEEAAIEVVRKSAETERIAAADVEFDRSFSGMREFAKTNLKHYDPNVRYAAENQWVIFEHYGNITKQAYHQELGSSMNLLQELRAKDADYTASGISPWANAHELAANTLAELLSERNVEMSQQSDLRVRGVRLRMDTVYQKVTDRLDAKINLDGKDYVPGFYAEYNTHATEYKHKLAQHLGRIRKNEAKGIA
jgi:hypothetical protein